MGRLVLPGASCFTSLLRVTGPVLIVAVQGRREWYDNQAPVLIVLTRAVVDSLVFSHPEDKHKRTAVRPSGISSRRDSQLDHRQQDPRSVSHPVPRHQLHCEHFHCSSQALCAHCPRFPDSW